MFTSTDLPLPAKSGRAVISTAFSVLVDPSVVRDEPHPRLLARSSRSSHDSTCLFRGRLGAGTRGQLIQRFGLPLPTDLSSSTHRCLDALRWRSRFSRRSHRSALGTHRNNGCQGFSSGNLDPESTMLGTILDGVAEAPVNTAL